MATNQPAGDGHRNGAVRKRSQLQAEDNSWTKRDKSTGEFMDRKSAGPKFKGVRTETRKEKGASNAKQSRH